VRELTAYLSRLGMAGFRPRTVASRRDCLEAFARFVAPKDLLHATRLDVESYLGRPLKQESRRAYLGHLRAFYRWAVDEELLTVDPTARIPAVRVPRAMPRPIGTADLERALALADRRMRAWLLLMALAGLRCIEVAALRPADLMPTDSGTLLWLRECKGGGTASVPAHPAILEALAVLPIRNGLWWGCQARHVSVTVAAHLKSCGVNATGHQLRHFAGTSWYRASGHDLLATATLLRHANVQTTQRYAQLDPTRPAQVVNAVPLRLVEGEAS
jgi:integrase